ncbi:putative ABC transport system ATP-binding protein [Paenibacillus taihuensis]|uniref:Putative ABC transport system ATP-binding protein n=1 Tax=Paenibacillus taihuensis TaxID=1156355 RepID=A0A3D9SH42_9BACL|nr:ATP-binding cassette domain-containing protein [Paenibacillus taihuensis]REE91605.1 putative ABC transport system ATP-binding protein [Paenibacillus taihuensis]
MFEIKQLAKRPFHMNKTDDKYLLSNISAEVVRGEWISLLGASGQGKSTLLRMFSLLHSPDEGDMLLEGISFRNQHPRFWRKQICYVAQQAVMLTGTVEDNLKVPSQLHQLTYDSQLAKRLLAAAKLSDVDLKKDARELSGGQMQRIALIRSLMLRPTVLLLDEVTSSLDVTNTLAIEELLKDWHRNEGTIMIGITHDLKQAERVSTRTWFLAEGTILEDAPAKQFFISPSTEAASQFIISGQAEVLAT